MSVEALLFETPQQNQDVQTYHMRPVDRAVVALSASIALLMGHGTINPAIAHADTTSSIADFTNGYPNQDAAPYNEATYDWWVDENGNNKADVTASTTDNDEVMSSRLYNYRNCTDGVAYWASTYLSKSVSGWGHASNWNEAAKSAGYTIKNGNSNEIEPGDIAQSDDGSFGHVGFVTDVMKNAAGKIVKIRVAELNKDTHGNFSHDWHQTKNSSGNFIRSSGDRDWETFIDVDGSTPNTNTPAAAPNLDPIPAVVQRPNGETNFVVVAPDKTLDYYFNPGGEGTWHKLDIPDSNTKSTPAAILRPSGELNIVAQGDDDSLDYYMNMPGVNAWHKIEIAGSGSAHSAPSIIQRPSGETDVVVQGPNNTLDFYYNIQGSPIWTKITVPNGQAYSKPAIVQRPNGETNIVARTRQKYVFLLQCSELSNLGQNTSHRK
ncbi:MAG: CHAP domain-containing protein [Candidatus Saccharimonadales bacterium]